MQLHINFNDTYGWRDWTDLLKDNPVIDHQICSDELTNAQSLFDCELDIEPGSAEEALLNAATDWIYVRFYGLDEQLEFEGCFKSSYSYKTDGLISQGFSLSAVDYSELLRVEIDEPEQYAWFNKKILDPADPNNSIIHLLWNFTNLPTTLITNEVIIPNVLQVYTPSDKNILASIDVLLHEFGWVCNFNNGIFRPWQWAHETITPVFEFNEETCLNTIEVERDEKKGDVIKITWNGLTEENALVYNENLPFDETGQRSGYPIPEGYYYPADSNVEEVYQKYTDKGLVDVVESILSPIGQKAIAKKNWGIIATRNHTIDDSFDVGVSRVETQFFNHKARIQYFNNTVTAKNLYYSEIRADVTYRNSEHVTKVQLGDSTQDSFAYSAAHLHTKIDADKYASALAAFFSGQHLRYTIISDSIVPIGSFVSVSIRGNTQLCLVLQRTHEYKEQPLTGHFYHYQLIGFSEYLIGSSGHSSSYPSVEPIKIGLPGQPGEPGITLYTWIAYSNNPMGTSGFTTGSWTNQTYIGIAVNKTTPTKSTDPAEYTWSKIVGATGATGAQGATGPQGVAGSQGPAGTPAPVYRGALSATPSSPVNKDFYLSTVTTASPARTKGRIYQYNGSSWVDATSNTTLRGVAMPDLLSLAESVPSGTIQIADIFAQQLISMQATIEALQTKVLQFEESVSSIARAIPQVGDLQIYMGKDPRRPTDTNRQFEFALKEYLGNNGLAQNGEEWMNHLITKIFAGALTVAVSGCIQAPTIKSMPADVWIERNVNLPETNSYLTEIEGNSNCLIALSSANKFVRSTNAGLTWTVIDSPVNSPPAGIYYNNNVWIAAHINGISRSSNNGLNWTKVYDSPNAGSRSVLYSKNEWIVGGVSGGLFKSNNNGLNWTYVAVPSLTGYFVTKMGVGNGIIIGLLAAAGTSTVIVARSIDNGTTWQRNNALAEPFESIAYGNGVWMVASYNKLFISRDGGLNWGGIFNHNCQGNIASVNYIDNIWVVTDTNGLSKSTNNGSTWTNNQAWPGYGIKDIINFQDNMIAVGFKNSKGSILTSGYLEAGAGIISRSTQNGWHIREFSDGTKLRVQNILAPIIVKRTTRLMLVNPGQIYNVTQITIPAGQWIISASVNYQTENNHSSFSYETWITRTSAGSNNFWSFVNSEDLGETGLRTWLGAYTLNGGDAVFPAYYVNFPTQATLFLTAKANAGGQNGCSVSGQILAMPV